MATITAAPRTITPKAITTFSNPSEPTSSTPSAHGRRQPRAFSWQRECADRCSAPTIRTGWYCVAVGKALRHAARGWYVDAPEVLEVFPGDQIAFTLKFTHVVTIKLVWASLYAQGDSPQVPELTLVSKLTTDTADHHKITTVEFGSLTEAPAVDGEYLLGPVYVGTYLGQTNVVEGVPAVRCRLHREEPMEPPIFSYFDWG
jgi:hypothetical protein